MEMKKIMIVDDNSHIRKLTDRVVSLKGYGFESYSDGLCAFNRLRALDEMGKNNYFSLILSDVSMPFMDGIEFASHCNGLTDSPLVLITGNYGTTRPKNVREIIYKPVSLNEYSRVLNSYASIL